MSASKRKGTSWESAIVDYLRANGATQAERRTLCGIHDRGDIAGIVGLVIEAKAEKTITLAEYLTETERERINDGARVGVAWVKRRGKTSPGDAYVVMTGDNLIRLLVDAGYITEPAPVVVPQHTNPLYDPRCNRDLPIPGTGCNRGRANCRYPECTYPEPEPVVAPYLFTAGQVDGIEDVALPGMEVA